MAHPKGVLIERLQKEGRQPQFKTEATGPDHEPTFLSDAIVEGEVLGTGQGATKRDAEKRAAEEAIRHLDRQQRGVQRSQEGKAQDGKGPKPQGRRGRKKGSAEEEPPAEAAHAPEGVDGPFDGPWPIFEDVLAATLEIANDRLDRKETGETAIRAVRDLALDLYKGTLESLGDVVDLEDDES